MEKIKLCCDCMKIPNIIPTDNGWFIYCEKGCKKWNGTFRNKKDAIRDWNNIISNNNYGSEV